MMAHVVQDQPTSPVPESPSRSGTYRYYEGFIDKKGPRDRNFEKKWAILEGDSLHFFAQKIGNRELCTQKPMDTLTFDRTSSAIPEAKDRCRMTLKCKQGATKIKATSAEDLEGLWLKVLAVSTAIIPTERDLLPGQKQMFADIAAKELARKLIGDSGVIGSGVPIGLRKTIHKANSVEPVPVSSPQRSMSDPMDESTLYKFYPDHLKSQLPTPPPWFFHKISRDHAEQILLKNPDQGHLLIRVSESHPGEYSLSVRQDMGSIGVKHYRFKWERRSFKLLIDEEQPELASMYELIMFFIERSGGNLKPIQTRDPKVLKLPDNLYEHRFHQLTQGINPENGESHYRNRLSIQRAKTINAGRTTESNYLIPESNAKDANRPNRISLPASFNQGFKPGMPGLTSPTLHEGIPQNNISPGSNRGFKSQSCRLQGSPTGQSNTAYYKSPDPNNGYMMMSSQPRQQLTRGDKEAYINYRNPNGTPDPPIRPLPEVPDTRKRSISTSVLPSGYRPDVPNSFNSKSSNETDLRKALERMGVNRP